MAQAFKSAPQAIGKSRGGWNTKIHLVATHDRTAIFIALTPGNERDAPAGCLKSWVRCRMPLPMDRVCEGGQTRQLMSRSRHDACCAPKRNRLSPWEYDRVLYKKRNKVEGLFRWLKEIR